MAQTVKLKNLESKKIRLKRVLKTLKKTYPDAHCALDFETPFQLLIATILSAQCTDKRVNLVTPALFERYPDARSMAQAPLHELENLIRTTGFYQNKSKSLSETSRMIVEKHQGKVPQTLEELSELRGVGRKTANVVLGNVFGVPGLVVDTHVGRLCRRMGFTQQKDPEKVEQEMMKIVPQSEWTLFSHLLISHGRAICSARNPKCTHCPIKEDCPQTGI